MSGGLIPSPNRSRALPFHELDSKTFEEVCRAILDNDPRLSNVDLFGTPGQKQFGIDIVGHRRDGTGIEVVSCKCHSSLKPKQIRKFSDEFIEHFDTRWRAENVQRFVLAVASGIDALNLREAIAREIKRFREIGIEYEAWGPKQLQERLRPHRRIVSQYLGEHSASLKGNASFPWWPQSGNR